MASALVLGAAALLDYSLGDPQDWLHPVQIMGAVIQAYTQPLLKGQNRLVPRWRMRLAGIGLGLILVGGTGLLSWGILTALNRDGLTLLSQGLAIVWLASCFAGRSLRQAAVTVLTPLSQGQLASARQQLRGYVGRDTDALSATEMLRAVMETVSENATDGVMAPLFYAILGALLGLGPVPLALAYKAASTLDSMVGYREPPYTDLGWFSARLEDGLTWLPCRLTVLTIALLSGRPGRVMQRCRRDAPQDPSPNAGWSECAYAAALGVQLGGVNYYRGQVKDKPALGDPDRPITPEVVHQALRLTRYSFLLWLSLALGGLIALPPSAML
ncbi:cobalamin biosynthesis protein [Romeria aff. gracilis LEGE 07310]|uniref:Cobalamin biosynthesis protein CobD n=1 Tax=Vasconcelosia minhoensis LEGE 07310 TaxID=915328 RepID=A0A8J7DA09_9CYAN|nr:adenosylcobinamide-phosphate synthase CbiB [Romeria gracilis]MBE9075907.1 cobalamin biosynthesis protein [Romeria aff. gracilis LEGE 07310]